MSAPPGDLDALHVATLNLRYFADRWDQRLPLLLADMRALQPDVMGLQEVIFPLQQDRLMGAAGPVALPALRGSPGEPEIGNSLLVRQPLQVVGRRAPGPQRGALRHRGHRPAAGRLAGPGRRHAPPPCRGR